MVSPLRCSTRSMVRKHGNGRICRAWSSAKIALPAQPQHPIAPPPRMEPVAGAAQRATNVLDRVTGQAHADRLMAIGEFVVHDYLRKGASEGCHTEEL